MKKILFILFIFFCPCFFSLAQNIDIQKDAVEEISRAAAKIKTLKCTFVQTKTLKMLDNKLISKGRMFCSQPSKLRWEYITPYSYTFILNENTVLLKKGEHNNKIDVNSNKMFKEIARIMMNSVLGKCLTDKKSFRVSIAQKENLYLATLIPTKREMKQMFSKIILHYDRTESMVKSVEMFEHNGDTTLISLKNIEKNVVINSLVYNVE